MTFASIMSGWVRKLSSRRRRSPVRRRFAGDGRRIEALEQRIQFRIPSGTFEIDRVNWKVNVNARDPDSPNAEIRCYAQFNNNSDNMTPSMWTHGHRVELPIPEKVVDGHTNQRIEVFCRDVQTREYESAGIERKVAAGEDKSKFRNEFGTGNFEGITETADGRLIASGWAFDTDTQSLPVTVIVHINDEESGRFLANLPRPDVNRVTGIPGDHGFAIDITDMIDDTQWGTPTDVKITILDPVNAVFPNVTLHDPVSNGKQTFMNHEPTGQVSRPTNFVVAGSASDSDAPQSTVFVNLYDATNPNVPLETKPADEPQGGGHGFSFDLLPYLALGEPGKFFVTGADSLNGDERTIGEPFSVVNSKPSDTGVIYDRINNRLSGRATDVDAKNVSLVIEVELDGQSVGKTKTNAEGEWSFDIPASELSPGKEGVRADVFAYDAHATDEKTVIGTQLVGNAVPQVDAMLDIDTRLLSGTVREDGRAVVRVLLDDVEIGRTATDATGRWAYSLWSNSLSVGQKVTVIAIDHQTGLENETGDELQVSDVSTGGFFVVMPGQESVWGQVTSSTPRVSIVSQGLPAGSYTGTGSGDPVHAFDGDAASTWSAGTWATPRPQYVEVDLHESNSLRDLIMTVIQSPAGMTRHEVYVSGSPIGDDVSRARLATVIEGDTFSRQVLHVDLQGLDGRYIQVRTVTSPSWVAWQDIQVFADYETQDLTVVLDDSLFLTTQTDANGQWQRATPDDYSNVAVFTQDRVTRQTVELDRYLIGDVNHDGFFDSSDLVSLFARGAYEDGVAKNSTFEDGDFDGDRDVTTADLIAAFQGGHYEIHDDEIVDSELAMNDELLTIMAASVAANRPLVPTGASG